MFVGDTLKFIERQLNRWEDLQETQETRQVWTTSKASTEKKNKKRWTM